MSTKRPCSFRYFGALLVEYQKRLFCLFLSCPKKHLLAFFIVPQIAFFTVFHYERALSLPAYSARIIVQLSLSIKTHELFTTLFQTFPFSLSALCLVLLFPLRVILPKFCHPETPILFPILHAKSILFHTTIPLPVFSKSVVTCCHPLSPRSALVFIGVCGCLGDRVSSFFKRYPYIHCKYTNVM